MLLQSLSHHSKSFPHLTDTKILFSRDKLGFVFYSTCGSSHDRELLIPCALLLPSVLCPPQAIELSEAKLFPSELSQIILANRKIILLEKNR